MPPPATVDGKRRSGNGAENVNAANGFKACFAPSAIQSGHCLLTGDDPMSLLPVTEPAFRRITAAVCALASIAIGAERAAADELRREPLNGTVYAITGSVANVSFSAGPDGVFVVDSGGRSGARAVLDLIDEVSHGPIRYLVNTHAHPAHTGGNARLADRGAVIVAHAAVRDVLIENGADAAALPRFTLSELGRVSFAFNAESIRVLHVPPAHSPGNLIVHYEGSNVIHMGELFSPVRYPALAGGTIAAYIRALDEAVKAASFETLVVPARGPVSDREGLIAYRDMLIAVRDRVIEALDQGQTLEQFVAMRPTREFDAQYGDPSDPLFLPVIFDELSLRRQPAGQ
jgi:glyoxylase-like metal-dependent hydrolase (beta-lactamase superfamily II)